MGRALEEIQKSILLKKESTSSLDGLEVLTTDERQTLNNLNSSSKVAIWRLWVYIYSFAIYLHEQIFDAHKVEIEDLIARNKIHTSRWYRGKALLFQFGYNLAFESDLYDNTGLDEADILASKIIKQSSVEEIGGRLRIKVAKDEPVGTLAPLEEDEIFAFRQYMELVKDAGTRLTILSREPDSFRVNIDLYYNPLILDLNGSRLDGNGDAPVLDGIKEFLYNLEFNGEYITTRLVDYLQTIQGVEFPVVKEAAAKYGSFAYTIIDETYIADAGYMVLDEDNTNINFIPRELF